MYSILNIVNVVLLSIFRHLKNILKSVQSISSNYFYQRHKKNSKKLDKKKVFDSSKYQYCPVTYKSCVLVYNRIKNRLIEKDYKDLNQNCANLINYLPDLLQIADKSACGQIRANGYFSYSKIIFKFLECLEQELNSKKSEKKLRKEIDHLYEISVFLKKSIEKVKIIFEDTNLENEDTKKKLETELLKNYPEFHHNLQIYKQIIVKKRSISSNNQNSIYDQSCDEINNNLKDCNSFIDASVDQEFNSLPLFTPNLSTIFNSNNEIFYLQNVSRNCLFYGNHFMFWLDKDLSKVVKHYIFILLFLRVPFYRYFQLIFSPYYRAKTLIKILNFPTINFPFEIWDLVSTKFFHLYIDYKTRNTNTKSIQLFVPTQKSIIINKSPYKRLTINNTDVIKFKKNTKIRCKYIKSKEIEISRCSKLLLHLKGGGFFSQNADSFEIYLKQWVNYNQIPILSVDYRVKEPFPNGLQDCFDVYLWLKMAPEEEIRTKLGFYPKQIVITGDSAGGNLAMGIVLVLNDLRIDYKNKFNFKIPMPNGLALIYSPLMMDLSVSPSRSLSAIDPLLPPGILLFILHAISGRNPGLKPNNRLQSLRALIFPSSDPKPWMCCDQNEFKKRIESLSQMINSPFLCPLFYEKFDSLTDVPLYLLSTEFCPFLDESITLSKIYKGPIGIDVMPELVHGFLNLNYLNENLMNATIYCCKKVTELFK